MSLFRRFEPIKDMGDLVERLNLRRVWYWLALSSLVGVVGGLAAITFKWMTDEGIRLFWVQIIGRAPDAAGGEPFTFTTVAHAVWLPGLVIAPFLGGLLSAFLVYRFAPEAEGHGTDAAIRAYHRDRGRIRSRIPLVKLLASAFTLASGGSAGREGPIAQIGAGFGSLLGGWLKLSDRERRILLAVGMASGIGAIFRAPLAGAIFAAEVLYREPEFEGEVVVPALLSSIVAYSLYCSVHGFGHLLSGTSGFAFTRPLALLAYAVLGLVSALSAIAFINTFNAVTAFFKRLKLSVYIKPAIGGALTGAIGLAGWLALDDSSVLAVMGSGYGTLQKAVSIDPLTPSITVLLVVGLGKMLTTSLTIGSGGSGGVFGPSVVIGGCLGGFVGALFHLWAPHVVPHVAPFTIVGMAGFFAGAAKTPISTLLMVADITGNYALLLPSMLVVGLSYLIAHRWTIYPEQVRTRSDSPAHRGEFLRDILADVTVSDVLDRNRVLSTVEPHTPLGEITRMIAQTTQQNFPVVTREGKLVGIFSLDAVRAVLYESDIAGLVVAKDLTNQELVAVTPTDTLQRALELLTAENLDELPVVDDDDDAQLLGLIARRDIITAYQKRLAQAIKAARPAGV